MSAVTLVIFSMSVLKLWKYRFLVTTVTPELLLYVCVFYVTFVFRPLKLQLVAYIQSLKPFKTFSISWLWSLENQYILSKGYFLLEYLTTIRYMGRDRMCWMIRASRSLCFVASPLVHFARVGACDCSESRDATEDFPPHVSYCCNSLSSIPQWKCANVRPICLRFYKPTSAFKKSICFLGEIYC